MNLNQLTDEIIYNFSRTINFQNYDNMAVLIKQRNFQSKHKEARNRE